MNQDGMAERPDAPPAKKVGDFIARRFATGVFGVSTASPEMASSAASSAPRNRPRFIQAPHEGQAAFMACACEVHREVGVCLATSGPGAIHVLNGLYDA